MTIRLTVQLLGACALLASAAPAEAEPVADAATIAQRLLDTLRETNGVPGMGAAVWQDGQIVWEGSSGLRDVEGGAPVTRDTLFRLASVSKLFTVTAAAKLAEEGRLDLDAPVQAQLPWLGARWPAITPRQLAAHVIGAAALSGRRSRSRSPSLSHRARGGRDLRRSRPAQPARHRLQLFVMGLHAARHPGRGTARANPSPTM